MITHTVNNQPVPVKTEREARQGRYIQLTTAFLDGERDLLESAAASLQAGGIPFCLVQTPRGAEIWRTLNGYKYR